MARRETSYPEPIRKGTKDYENGESWTNWWLFSPPLNKEQADDFMEDNYIEAHYIAPGQPFSRGGNVDHSRSYTLIKHDGGYDV